MVTDSKINRIFSPSDVKHGISIFSNDELQSIEARISKKDDKYFINDPIKDKSRIAKPEEIVRQLIIQRLIDEFGYPKERIDVERVVYFGSRDSGFADIVVLHDDLTHPYLIFEIKRPKRSDGLEQLKSYCNAEGAPIGIWTNGNEMIRLHREEPNIFVEIPRVPRITETLRDILTERWNLKWLEEHDELRAGKTTLKKILLDLEELVLGNAGVDPFDEIFKLIYAKLYDEWKGINDPNYNLEFFIGDKNPARVKESILNLLEGAKRTWPGIFEPTEVIDLRSEHLMVCVSFLSKIKLFNSNLRIIDEAFEYLIPQVAKKKEGQFFTPRIVEDMIVKMLNPKPDEFVIDPACGSAGFLLHSVMWVSGGKFTGKELSTRAKNFAQNNIYGIDFAKKAVKIAKAVNLILGDGKSHIFKDNALAPQTWTDETKTGMRQHLRRFLDNPDDDRKNQENFIHFNFDLLLTNPPFAGTVSERDILRLYKLGEKNGKLVKKIGRHILFIDRSLQYLRPEGRMAIIIPQGLVNNRNTEYIREFVMDEAKILAVVGLHVNTFKPHTGTKTSILFLEKYSEEEKQKISEIKLSKEEEWNRYFEKLSNKHQNAKWDTKVDENELEQTLKDFINSYFDQTEELDGFDEDDENSEKEDEESLFYLVAQLGVAEELSKEKESELENIQDREKRKAINKELRTIRI